MRTRRIVAGALLGLALAACGGSKPAPVASPSGALTPGPHTLALALDPRAGLPTPVSGISITLRLPAGLTVATSDPVTGEIAPTSLSAGSALPGTAVLQGGWSAARREASLVVAATPTAAWSGEYLRLGFTVEPGTSATAADLLALNSSPGSYRVIGVDAGSRSTVVLSGQAPTSLQVVSP